MQRSKPEHAPLRGGTVICHTCGSELKGKPVMGRNGVSTVRWECRNAKTGCAYYIEGNEYLTGEVQPLRPDGKAL